MEIDYFCRRKKEKIMKIIENFNKIMNELRVVYFIRMIKKENAKRR